MTRKILCVLAIILFLVSVSFAEDSITLDYKLLNSMRSLAEKIISSNKPAFEQELTGQELEYYREESSNKQHAKAAWDKVWAKNNTIVAATAVNDIKKFQFEQFITSDPKEIFAGGLHVGSSLKDLENFLKTKILNRPEDYFDENLSAENIDVKENYISMSFPNFFDDGKFEGYDHLIIMHSDGKITQFGYFTGGSSVLRKIATREKTNSFVKSQMREMGMKEFPAIKDETESK
ncbi:MAG: hypothetical protein IJS99_05750 [Synergistaceae bacterium]|nr:hypothetical protein [Synergistaceae bacterium]